MRPLLFALFLLASLPATDAAPLLYRYDMTAGFSPGHPLYRAQIRLDMVWDPALLVPEFAEHPTFSEALWPSTNTTATMRLFGTANLDGVYAVNVHNNWRYFSGPESLKTAMVTPFIHVPLGDDFIDVRPIYTDFAKVGELGPKPFKTEEMISLAKPWIWMRGYGVPQEQMATAMTASAVFVPEPTTALMAAAAFARAVTIFRCRK